MMSNPWGTKDRFFFPKWIAEVEELIARRLWKELMYTYME